MGSAPRWLVGAEDGSRAETPDDVEGVFDDEDDEDAVCVADEEVEVWIAMDSGAVDHVIGPQDLPANAKVKPSQGRRATRNFTAANGSAMSNYGEVDVVMEGDDGDMANGSFAVTDVTRGLHATSRICDNDCTVVTTKGVSHVYKGEINIIGRKPVATYHRKGGLYMRKVKLRAGRKENLAKGVGQQPSQTGKPASTIRPSAPKSGFIRPGMNR